MNFPFSDFSFLCFLALRNVQVAPDALAEQPTSSAPNEGAQVLLDPTLGAGGGGGKDESPQVEDTTVGPGALVQASLPPSHRLDANVLGLSRPHHLTELKNEWDSLESSFASFSGKLKVR